MAVNSRVEILALFVTNSEEEEEAVEGDDEEEAHFIICYSVSSPLDGDNLPQML